MLCCCGRHCGGRHGVRHPLLLWEWACRFAPHRSTATPCRSQTPCSLYRRSAAVRPHVPWWRARPQRGKPRNMHSNSTVTDCQPSHRFKLFIKLGLSGIQGTYCLARARKSSQSVLYCA
jgi:hypothetical protein